MASIVNDPGGRKRILFVDPGGDRKAVRLGKASQRSAEGVKYRVEQLLEAQLLKRAMEADLADWVASLDRRMAKKLAAVGLIPQLEQKAAATLGPFLTGYIAGRTDVKPLTKRHLEEARKKLVAFFGESKSIKEITPGDSDAFRLRLLEKLGDNTVRRMCGRAKQFFRAAVRKRLIRENPFADMTGCGVRANRSRDYYVSRADAQKVLEACPDTLWRLLFALSRFGGLRCPSEHLALRWGDVDWAQSRITVQSPKTEHHEGKESRVIPLFPELRPYLEEAFDEAEPGTEYVITRYRDANANLRTQLERIIRRAGLEPWPKLFHNLRATRQTELAQQFPMHVVCEWIGNSQTVAMKHYLQVTDADYQRATGAAAERVAPNCSEAKTAQKTAQQAHAGDGTESQPGSQTDGIAGENGTVRVGAMALVPPDGLEPSTL